MLAGKSLCHSFIVVDSGFGIVTVLIVLGYGRTALLPRSINFYSLLCELG